MRGIKFTNGEYYHIYNRAVADSLLFREDEDYKIFKKCLRDFNNKSYYEERAFMARKNIKELNSFLAGLKKIVVINAYNLLPNHYHLILKQLTDDGISKFLHKIGYSYTNFINKKYNRSGRLFQGTYKAIHIDNDDYLLWLSAYINGNSQIHKIADTEDYPWTSYGFFLGKKLDDLVTDKDIILDHFSGVQGLNPAIEYKKFVKMVIKESRNKKDIDKYLIEKS
jgi:putative transposase